MTTALVVQVGSMTDAQRRTAAAAVHAALPALLAAFVPSMISADRNLKGKL